MERREQSSVYKKDGDIDSMLATAPFIQTSSRQGLTVASATLPSSIWSTTRSFWLNGINGDRAI